MTSAPCVSQKVRRPMRPSNENSARKADHGLGVASPNPIAAAFAPARSKDTRLEPQLGQLGTSSAQSFPQYQHGFTMSLSTRRSKTNPTHQIYGIFAPIFH